MRSTFPKQMRKQDIKFMHAFCDAYPEWEHKRPTIGRPKKEPRCDEHIAVIEPEMICFAPPKTMREAAVQASYIFNISPQELLGPGRPGHVIPARIAFVKTCRELLKKSFPEISRFMNNRHHTTALHYWEKRDTVDVEMGGVI